MRCSDHQVYEDEEIEVEEVECDECNGSGEIDIDPDDFHFDDFNDEFLIDDLIMRGVIDCEKCDGTGVVLHEKVVKYRDSWTTSNIFI
jgi:hypothetical protein